MIMIELRDLIGVPYKVHGRTKEEGFDCYGIAIEVYKRAGLSIPDVFYTNTECTENEKTASILVNGIPHTVLKKPELYCIIGLLVNKRFTHIGIYIGDGEMIHATTNCGVCIQKLARWQNRIAGYFKVNS